MSTTADSFDLHLQQSIAYMSEATELLYGGAAGGGKSAFLRFSAVRWCDKVPGCQSYLFRRTMDDVRANHLEGPANLFDLLGPALKDGRVVHNKQSCTFRWARTDSILRLASLEHPGDLIKFHGRQITVLQFDELTHFTEAEYTYLRGRCRLGGLKVPKEYKGMLPRVESASNPGNIGHAWVKRAFITRAAPYEVWRAPRHEGGKLRVFIPAKLEDNPTIKETDPDYEVTLEGMGSPALVRALKDGDWDIVAGQAFEMFNRERHVIEPFEIPAHWTRFRAMDWGFRKPFSVGWWAVADGDFHPDGRYIPKEALIRYREWYGYTGKPDVGLGLPAEEVARGILAREWPDEKIAFSVADYQIWAKVDGPTVGEKMALEGVVFRRAEQSRTGMKARVPGLLSFITRLKGIEHQSGDGKVETVPMLYVFDTCVDGFIRTIPDLVLDKDNPEDLAPRQEDHVADECKYAAMSRSWARQSPPDKGRKKRDGYAASLALSEQPARPWMIA